MSVPGTIVPRGLGVYLASGDVAAKDVGREVERMADAQVRWACLFVEAPDGRRANTARLVTWAGALRAHGIEPWLWTFPRADRAVAAVQRAREALEATGARGLVLDVERPPPQVVESVEPRVRHLLEWTPETAREMTSVAIDALRERHGLGMTSYPARRGHELPWDELAVGWGSPQLYRSADDDRAIERSLEAYRAAHGIVVPVIDSYVGDHDRLRDVAHRIIGDRAAPRVPAIAVWAWGTTDARERRVLAEVAAGVGW